MLRNIGYKKKNVVKQFWRKSALAYFPSALKHSAGTACNFIKKEALAQVLAC